MATNLPLIPQFAENFIQNWAVKRQPEKSDQQTIDRHRLYILPTRHAISYFIVLLLILFASINYQNSLGFMLAFLLGSIGILGMIYTHQNLNQLNIKTGRAESVFVGQSISFPIRLTQASPSIRANVQIQSSTAQTICVDLINQKSIDFNLPQTATKRGYINLGRIKLFTEYPLGLFHAWSWLSLDAKCLVYPEPARQHPRLIKTAENNINQSNININGVDDFAGIRKYQRGDQSNHMAWKAIAKTGKLQTKLFNADASMETWIDWSETDEILNIEQRLSILCRMILEADIKNINYGLRIPGCIIQINSGLQHKHSCLKALALFGEN